jgi:hypothetical protein
MNEGGNMLVGSASMEEFFREAVGTALKRSHLLLSEQAESYVVRLLSEFSRSDRVYAGTERGEEPAMATLLSKAQEAMPDEAVRIYRHMGDSSLYLTGFFTESVQKKTVSVDYYVSMGGSAYASVAGLMRPTAAPASALFAELSERFEQLVDLLNAVSLIAVEGNPALTDSKVYELMERYRKTGRPELLRALENLGIVLRPGLNDDGNDVVH